MHLEPNHKVHKYSQEQNVIGSSAYILHPKHPFQGIWDLSVSFLLGLTLITIPLQLAFEEFNDSAGMLELGIVIDFVFLLDVVKVGGLLIDDQGGWAINR
jgi:hypothetical protein